MGRGINCILDRINKINRIRGKDFDRRNMKDMKNGPAEKKVFSSCGSCLSCLKISLSSNLINHINPIQMNFPQIDPCPFQRNLDFVPIRFWLPLLFLAVLAPVRGQDEPVHMRPEFPLIFPLAQKGKDVTVKFPVLINPATVVKPGMVLRVMYILSTDATDSSDLVLAHKGDMEEAYSRQPSSSSDEPTMPPELAHEIEGYRRTVWEVSNNFVLAMAQYPTDAMHLIYSPTGKDRDLDDERFSFFDGLLVGLPNGKVTVLAVEKESKAEKAGIKAGDEIVSVGGIPIQDDLGTFAAAYSTTKKIATENEVDTYPMTIRSEGGAGTRQVNILMPPRIKSSLMDGF
jgi:hypothetical protein